MRRKHYLALLVAAAMGLGTSPPARAADGPSSPAAAMCLFETAPAVSPAPLTPTISTVVARKPAAPEVPKMCLFKPEEAWVALATRLNFVPAVQLQAVPNPAVNAQKVQPPTNVTAKVK